jgi:hypothetical protein
MLSFVLSVCTYIYLLCRDELTLILAGGGLGFAAGLVQQGLACGSISIIPHSSWRWLASTITAASVGLCAYAIYFASSGIRLDTFRRRILKRLRDPSKVAFDALDTNQSGYLKPREIAQVAQILGINLSEKQLDEAFVELDKDVDGVVTLEEFEDWWNQDLGSDFHKQLAKELGLYRRRRIRSKWKRLALSYRR